MKEEEGKLRQEVEELRKSIKEEKIVRVVVEIRNGADKMIEVGIPQVDSNMVPTQVPIPSPKPQVPAPSPKSQSPVLSKRRGRQRGRGGRRRRERGEEGGGGGEGRG